jgi:hypothetical protein
MSKLHRHVILAAAVTILFVWGGMYSFPVWMPRFKERFQLTQATTDAMGAGIYVGTNLIGMPLGAIAQSIGVTGHKVITVLVQLLAIIGFLILYSTLVASVPSASMVPLIFMSITGTVSFIYSFSTC